MDNRAEPVSEFICPGCGRPLAITLRSELCFAEAQVYCADCERDYQQRRGKWADLFIDARNQRDRIRPQSALIPPESEAT